MDKEFKIKLAYNLQFFAQDGPGGEKTEPASQKKLDDARKDGKVAKSKELVSATSLLAFFLLLKFYTSRLGTSFISSFRDIYSLVPDIVKNSKISYNSVNASAMISYVLQRILIIILPILIISFGIAFVTNVVQVKWKVTAKPLEPKLDKFNPINGFKRMFSVNTLMELLKNLVMMGIIIYIAYSTLKDKADYIYNFYSVSLKEALAIIGDLVIGLGIKISIIFLIVGFADLFYQKHKFNNDMKMTKQEVKDEYKQTEGDPQVKGQRKQKMREMSRRRMMNDLPKADVVITNPTHFAVALMYDNTIQKAPVVIAKGADFLAAQIKEKAKELNIEIVENRPLARMLYNNVEMGEEIPQELYQSVAEILALVYSIRETRK